MTGRGSIVIDARANSLPGAHGIARSVLKLAEHMPPGEDDLDLRVLVNPERSWLFPMPGLPAHARLIETGVRLGAAHRAGELARTLRAAGAAALYVPYPTFVPLLRPCPFVVTVHDCTIEGSAAFAGGRHRRAWLRLAFRAVLGRAAAVTAPSQASLSDLRRTYPRPERALVVPNGVDLAQFGARGTAAAETAAARARYDLPVRFVLAVGAHRPHKNHEILVRALRQLPDGVGLVVVGNPDPAFPGRLPRLIGDLGLGPRVRLLQDVPDRDLPAIYRAAAALAFPSLAEGFGLPVLEAMAAGIPVVASDIPAVAEVAGTGALLVPPRAEAAWTGALRTVLTDEELARALVKAGSAVAAEAGWERGAARLRALLAEVATVAGPAGASGSAGAAGAAGSAGAGRRVSPGRRACRGVRVRRGRRACRVRRGGRGRQVRRGPLAPSGGWGASPVLTGSPEEAADRPGPLVADGAPLAGLPLGGSLRAWSRACRPGRDRGGRAGWRGVLRPGPAVPRGRRHHQRAHQGGAALVPAWPGSGRRCGVPR